MKITEKIMKHCESCGTPKHHVTNWQMLKQWIAFMTWNTTASIYQAAFRRPGHAALVFLLQSAPPPSHPADQHTKIGDHKRQSGKAVMKCCWKCDFFAQLVCKFWHIRKVLWGNGGQIWKIQKSTPISEHITTGILEAWWSQIGPKSANINMHSFLDVHGVPSNL